MPSLYDTTIPVFIRGLTSLSTMLDKAREWAGDAGVAEAALTDARLIADMHPLVYQVQRASDTAKGTAVRVGQVENAVFADEEATIDDLKARIAKTIAFLEAVPREAIDGREEARVVLTLPNREMEFTGTSYATGFALPNFFFHVSMAYALLRMKGVPLGKRDFLGAG